MNRVPTYEYYVLDFNFSRSLLETAKIDSEELRVTIAKVLCYSLIAFCAIAAFESIVINGAKFVLNIGVWVLNTSNDLLFQKESTELLPPPPVPVPAIIPIAVIDEPMPPIDPLVEKEFCEVFEILATAHLLRLPFLTPYLAGFRERTKYLHPLQVVGFLLEPNSPQRKHATFIDRAILGPTFASDTAEGFTVPKHAENTSKYIASFAKKVGITVEAAQGFLLQNPPHLVDLVHYVLRKEKRAG